MAGSDACKTKAAEMLRLAQLAMRHEDKQFYLPLALRWHELGMRRDLELPEASQTQSANHNSGSGIALRMEDALTRAKLYHDEATKTEALAWEEHDPERHQLLLSVAEQYYMLHDTLMELSLHPRTAAVFSFKR